MFRNISRLASIRWINLNLNQSNPLIGLNSRSRVDFTHSLPNFGKDQFDRSKYFAVYFYKLLGDYYTKQTNYEQLRNDLFFESNYQETMRLLDKETKLKQGTFEIVDKLSILRSLQVIGVPSNDELIVKLIEDLSPNLNKLTLEKTLKVLLNQVQFQSSEVQKMFIRNLVNYIEERPDDVVNLNIVLMIYNEKITDLFSTEFLSKVDNQALELCKTATEKPLAEQEITWFLHRISLTKRRPKQLIQYLVNGLIEKDFKHLDHKILISLINSLASLSYLSVHLMSKIINHLIKTDLTSKINKFDFNSLMKSFIILRYDPEELFHYLANDIDLFKDKLGTKCLMNLVSTMAFFNYSNEIATDLLNHQTFKEIDIDLIKDSVLSIEYLWSLAFYESLDKIPLDQLTLDFFTKILDNKYFYYLRPRYALLYHYCKLNLGLDVELPDTFFKQTTPTKEKDSVKADNLFLILEKENYLTNVETEFGFKFGKLDTTPLGWQIRWVIDISSNRALSPLPI